MATTSRDPLGTAVAILLGGFVGLALAYPAVPRDESVLLAGFELGPTETFLLVGALVVVLLPVLFVVLMTVMR